MNADELVAALKQHNIHTTSLIALRESGPDLLYRITVHGAKAVEHWQVLRGLVDDIGIWPLILGTDKDLEMLVEDRQYASEQTTHDIIQAGLQIDVLAWMRENATNVRRDHDWASWPGGATPMQGFTIPFNITTNEPWPVIYLALLPTSFGWQAPAFLRYGGWNDCPAAAVHVGMMKRWEGLYGAELVGMSHDTVEMRIADPPQDRSSALALAWEHYIYCPDVVDQGTGTIESLASILMYGTAWYFWWD